MYPRNCTHWLSILLVSFSVAGAGLTTSGLAQPPKASPQSSTDLGQSGEPPIIPVGLDAYRQWDRLAEPRIGMRAYMRSTYDREGNNRTADASHYLYQEKDDFNVTLDVKGNGVLYFKRTNHWHGSPWHYEVDGQDYIVRETGTADPENAKETLTETHFLPKEAFPEPLAYTWTTTHGADLMWVPIAFQESLRLAYGRTFYGTGYYIYHQFPLGMDHLSQQLESWKMEAPADDVIALLDQSGTDIAPQGEGVTKQSGELSLPPKSWQTIADIDAGPSQVRALKFSIPKDQALEFGESRLRITWDNRWAASVDAPVALFFGAGHLYNDNQREYLVRGFPLNIRYEEDRVHLACYWPMPFFQNAKIELQNRSDRELSDLKWEIRTEALSGPINHQSWFHATYTDHPNPPEGQDMTLLDTQQLEGSPVWSGQLVGMSWIFSRDGNLRTLEGDPRFFFDDSKTPQAWGTGTEEWGGGGDYWGGRNMTLPFAGHPVGKEDKDAQNDLDLVNSAYRFLVADYFPFGRRAVVQLEHGSINQSTEHYSAVCYWYGVDSPALTQTDELNVCHPQSQKEHNYQSPTAEEPYTLVSRYELGPDGEGMERGRPPGFEPTQMYYPAEEDQVRVMTGESRFEVNVDPANLGVMLRRKFDYQYPNQHAQVWVRPAGTTEPWNFTGDWYTAGSNTCVHSFPYRQELGETEHNVVTSNRRWREEEFLIARKFTTGKKRLEIKLVHVPNDTPLYPGHPFPVRSAWSAARYQVFCYRMPQIQLD